MEVMPGYKQTEVGIIPEDWRVEPLVNSVKLQGGYAFRSIAFCDIGVPVIRISDVQRGSVDIDGAVCHPKIAIPVEFLIQEGDALMAMSGATTGKVGVYRQKQFAYQNQRVGKFVIKDKKRTSSSFIIQLVRSDSFLKRLAVFLEQGAQPNISSSQVESLVFPFPPTLAEQEAIAEALSDADALIESLEQLIAKKRQIKQGAMQELLTGKKRLLGFSGEWEVKRFGDIAQPRNERIDPRRTGPHEFCIELEHIGQGTGCLTGYARAEIGSSLKCVFQKGDVLFGKLRAYLRKFWMADRGGVCSTEIWVLVAERSQVISKFLIQLVKLDQFIEVASTAYGTHMPRSDWNVVKNWEIFLPSVEEQTAIVAILSDMDAEIAALEAKLAKARQLKQGMMQELLTGRIRLI